MKHENLRSVAENTVDFQTAFEALPGSFLILEPNAPHFTILAISDELLGVTSKERQNVMGKSVFEVYPENPEAITATGPSNLRTSLQNALQNKERDQMPVVRYDVLNADGRFEERYWSASNKPVLNTEGEVLFIILNPIEVTDQVKAEKRGSTLRKIEKNYNLFMQAPVAVCIVTGPENIVELANEEILRFLGRTSDIVGRPLFESIPEAKGQGFPELLDQVRKTGEPFYATEFPTTLLINGKEERRYYNFVYQPYYENPADKAPTGVFSVAHDVTEQVLARKRAEESEHRFRSLIEESPIATCLFTGRDMVVEVANEAMIGIWGKGASVVGKPLREVLPELEGQPFLQILDEVFTSGESYEAEAAEALLVRDGVPRVYYSDFSYKPLLNTAGEVYGIMSAAVDVTNQVLARRRIEESAKELKNLANAMPQIVWIAEANGEVTYYNDRISELAGAKKLPGGTWYWEGLLLPEDVQPTVEAWKKAVNEGTVYEKEHRLQTKQGTYRWHLSRAFPQRDEAGAVVKWFGTATDVHEQKEYEEALRRSEEQLRIAVEGGELGTFNFYPQIGKLIWSAKTKELMGLPPEAEVNPDTFWQALHPDDRERCNAVIQKALQAENGGSYENEYRIIGITNGKLRWMRSKGKVTFDGEGKAIRLTGVTQDLTERKQAEEALELKNAQLTRINNDLDNFIYTASHDLKSPIANIEGLLNLLSGELSAGSVEESEVQHVLGLMQNSVQRFKKTIAHLTDVIKLQNESIREATPVKLPEVVGEVLLDLEQLIEASGARIEVDLQECKTVSFSEKNLRSIVYNLVSNAVKYRSPDRPPLVRVTCHGEPGLAVLVVQDNGSGLQERQRGQLFTMFRRFHDQVEGTGIGLYMVKKMLDNAGGRIEVESQEGKGTTFRVYFKC